MIKRIILYIDSNLILGNNYTQEMKNNIKKININNEKKYQRYKNSSINIIPSYSDELLNIFRKLSSNYEIVIVNEKSKYINKIKKTKLDKYILNYYNNYIEACSYNNTNECIIITDKYNNDIIAAQKCGIRVITINIENNK